ncbi:MAG: helix-turn-helix transcriptional regulator [Subdoligranulum sp.]|nr:helix-turn-helix transcriptional regulator [Subdoligranulum sp.]
MQTILLPAKDNALIKDIGRRVQSRRKHLGLTQDQLAERANMSQQYIACVERGHKGMREESIHQAVTGAASEF